MKRNNRSAKMKHLAPIQNILDFGCGNHKRPGSLGIDSNPRSDADVIHDLNVFPYPFVDNQFTEVYADNVLEHLGNVFAVIEELNRITKPGGLVKIIVPYFRSRYAFIDPTHVHYFTVLSFGYFEAGNPLSERYRYTNCRYRIDRITFNENLKVGLFAKLMTKLANRWPRHYEAYLSHLFPLDQITFDLSVVK